ncbi:MAG: DUF1569 domain-containing protein [Cytophagaceae bacterium]
MKNVFEAGVASELIGRINNLNAESKPQWGKMTVGQMLAHCNVAYVQEFETKFKKPNGIVRFLLRIFIKDMVTNEVPFKPNKITSKNFRIKEDKNFSKEKEKLIAFINKTQLLGENHFDNRESFSFGKLTKQEWSNMFYKHLDHHLKQFGV